MKKIKVQLPSERWKGQNTKYPNRSLLVEDDEFTEGTKNINVNDRGVITKRQGNTLYNATPLSEPAKDLYEAVFSDGVRHLLAVSDGDLLFSTGDGAFTTVHEGYSALGNFEFATYRDRVYFDNGIDTPQVYDREGSYGDVGYTPVTIEVVNYASLSGAVLTVGGTDLTEGVEWTAATDNETTATSLAAAIDALANITASATDEFVTVEASETTGVVSDDPVNLEVTPNSFPRVKDMGADAPGSAISGSEGSSGNVVDGSYLYKTTFLYYGFEESNGGTASSTVTVSSGPSDVSLTGIPLGGYGVTARKIYRSGDAGATYRLVLTISNNTATTGTDNTASGTTLIPIDNDAPQTFSLIVQNKDKNWIAGIPGDPSKVWPSSAGLPDVFKSDAFILCNQRDPITGLAVYNDKPVIFNRKSFGQIFGNDPASFRYVEVPGSVGCVDNRTIQVRTTQGVPILLWLSDEGFYGFNGTTVDYISDKIENLVNVNIQQASQSRNSHTDTTQTDFAGGTASPGIVLNAPAGSVTVANPKKVWQTKAAWEAGTLLTNVVTNSVPTQAANRIGVPVAHTLDYTADGEVTSGSPIVESDSLSLPVVADIDGTTTFATGTDSLAPRVPGPQMARAFARKITLSSGGVIGNASVRLAGRDPLGAAFATFNYKVWNDSFGTPGSVVASSSLQTTGTLSSSTFVQPTAAINATVAAGTYWIGVEFSSNMELTGISDRSDGAIVKALQAGTSTPWVDLNIINPGGSINHQVVGFSMHYVFSQTPVASSATWESDVIDTGIFSTSDNRAVYIKAVGTYPTNTTINVAVDQSNDATFAVIDETLDFDDLDGTEQLNFGNTTRYYRITFTLETTDDRATPEIEEFSLGLGSGSSWVSETIDHTTDITAMNSIDLIASIPGSSSAILAVEKSTDGSTWAFEFASGIANGSQTISLASLTNPTRRYSRVSVVFVGSPGNFPTDTPQVSSLTLKWSVGSNLVSEAIDTGLAPPAGWDVFQASSETNGGTLVLEMRSASSGGGLSAASYSTVTNGTFPSAVPVLQFVQWRVTVTATADHVPILSNVTINWFVGQTGSIRAASLFFSGTYYVSVAEFGENTNNLFLVMDDNGFWHTYRGMSAGAFSFFFGQPYYADATVGDILKFQTGLTDNGDDIEMVVRTKAYDFGESTVRKALMKLFVIGKSSGQTLAASYSVDGGVTYLPLTDFAGATSFTLPDDGSFFTKRLVPAGGAELQGPTIMAQLVNNDDKECEIHEMILHVIVREGDLTDA